MVWKNVVDEIRGIKREMTAAEKIDTVDLVGKNLSLYKVGVIKTDRGNRVTVCFAHEIPDHFFFGGTVMTGIVTDLSEKMGGMDVLNTELAKNPMKIVLSTKKGKYNDYTDVEVL